MSAAAQFGLKGPSIVNDFSPSPSYITALAHTVLPGEGGVPRNLIAAASTDREIKIYDFDPASGNLTSAHVFKGEHKGPIGDIIFATGHPNVLCSASEDGSVISWDVRAGKKVARFAHPRAGKPLFSVDCAGTLLAAGSEEQTFIWDVRTGKPVRVLEGYHTDEIRQVRFHPYNKNLLLTGSDDGLISCIDLTVADEEECLKSVLNVEQPVAKMGFFGPAGQFMYSISTIETLSLWSIKQADRVSTFTDVRAQLSKAAGTPVHYLVNCHYDKETERLYLVAGDNGGGVILAHLLRDDVQPFCLLNTGNAVAAPGGNGAGALTEGDYDGSANLTNEHQAAAAGMQDEEEGGEDIRALLARAGPAEVSDDDSDDEGGGGVEDAKMLTGGGGAGGLLPPTMVTGLPEAHTEVVRAALWLGPYILTGGHDSKVCVWTSLPPTKEEEEAAAAAAAASAYKMKSSHQARAAQQKKKAGSRKAQRDAGSTVSPYGR